MRNLDLPEPDFADLTDDDRATALRLRASLAPITMTERPVPGVDGGSATPDPRTGRREQLDRRRASHRRGRRAVVGLVGAAAAGTIGVVLIDAGPGARGGLAWAADPEPATEVDLASAAALCATALADITTTGGPQEGGVRSGAVPSLPTSLPPIVTLDIRGGGGYAHFSDGRTRADCLLVRRDGRWERGPVVIDDVRPPLDTAALAVTTRGSTTWPDGTTVSFLTGEASAAVTARLAAVEVSWPDGTVATASLVGGSFVIWWPGDLSGDVTIRAVDTAGAPIAELSTVTTLPGDEGTPIGASSPPTRQP